MTDKERVPFESQQHWHVLCTPGKVEIRDASWRSGQMITGGLILLPVLASIGVFSLPIVRIVAVNDNVKAIDLLLSFAILLVGLVPGLFLLRLAIRLMIPWTVVLVVLPDQTLLRGGALGRLCPPRRRGRIDRLFVRPAYLRGDWGYQIWVQYLEGKATMLLPPRLVSNSIGEAETKARWAAQPIARHFSIDLLLSEEWTRYRRTAEHRHHAEG